MTSAHTSLAAARAPARSPEAALLQIPSTLAFTLAESVGAPAMIDLQIAAYCATPAAVAGLLGLVVGDVELVTVGDGLLGALVTGVLAAVAAVEVVVVELLLPHPATSAAHSRAATASVGRVRIIDPPWSWRTPARGRRAAQTSALGRQGYPGRRTQRRKLGR